MAVHDAYSRKSRERSTTLDVMYAPTLRLERQEDQSEFEADADRVEIKCMADANPEPDVVWRKAGGESLFSFGETLVFDPVTRTDKGTYFCMAKNEVGSSDELSVTFDVLYPPTNIRTEPRRFTDLKVGQKLRLECSAEGYPTPTFEWLQKVYEDNPSSPEDREKVYSRGSGRIFSLRNVSYQYEGQWACQAKNTIKGTLRAVSRSDV